MHINVLDIAPTTLDVITDITIAPHGTYRNTDGTPSAQLQVTVIGTGNDPITFLAGARPETTNVTFGMDGDPSTYPTDRYTMPIDVQVADAGIPVPVQIVLGDETHDWDLDTQFVSASQVGVNATMGISRSFAAVGFAIFQLGIMVCLAGIVTVVTLRTISAPSKAVEFSLLGWFAALLFALPAIRNTLPGTPGVGTNADYFVYFWALLLVAVCTITVAAVWVRQTYPPATRTAPSLHGDDGD